MNSSKKKVKITARLPSAYRELLITTESEYRRDLERKLQQLSHDTRNAMRRRHADNHVFTHALLTKRHHWFAVDKSYRDICRLRWNREYTQTGRTSHMLLPSVYSLESSSPLSMASGNTFGSSCYSEDENPTIVDERIKQDFLRIQPVMLELIRAPHSAKVLKHRQDIESGKKSARERQTHLQNTAINDKRFTKLIGTLQEV